MSGREKIAKVELVRSLERKVDGKNWQNQKSTEAALLPAAHEHLLRTDVCPDARFTQ